jgi:hypothetical protein
MVVIIGVCLCLIELRYLSGRNGVRSNDALHMFPREQQDALAADCAVER